MKTFPASSILFLSTFLLSFNSAQARPIGPTDELSIDDPVTDVVGDVDGSFGMPRKALADTIWIANWSFDGPGGCDDTGWEKVDNRIIADGQIHWSVESGFGGTGGIVANAAVLGYTGNHCCVEPEGYDNFWYEAIRLQYAGNATLSFDYLLDSETGFDFVQVETDSACASFARVDYDLDPASMAFQYRDLVFSDDGLVTAGTVAALGLTDYGPGTHCVYLAFFSDGGWSPCDGLWPTTLGRALVVDNVQLTDAGGATNLDFEGPVDPALFVGLHDSRPFGEWARLYRYITDNDACTENTTCAWLWTDYTTPTVANDPSMAFGPNGYVVRSWLDDMVVSPWVSLASTQTASGTVLRFRRFGGNSFNTSRIVHNWAVRGRTNVSGQDCIPYWGHASSNNNLDVFAWRTFTVDMTSYFDPGSEAIQIRHRVHDRQWNGGVIPPVPYRPGPGPYIDDTRIGRVVLSGPVLSEGIDARSQAQDCFATEIHPGIPLAAGEHHRPTTDRFGTCAFSQGADLGSGVWDNLITGDSVTVSVQDARNAGGVTAIEWYGAIVAGPHAGKAPAPYTVGTSGFFAVSADTSRNNFGVVPGVFFVDLDDTYFRGGDVVQYFWLATDAMGGKTSDPTGLGGVPNSVEEAEQATGGLLEVSFLPTIAWDPAYLARIAGDAHGDLAPTEVEIAASSQAHCILYVNHINTRRRSGDINRTTFMYTLDRLGYEYDVYDHSGMGNTNNHLGGRASVPQATGYSLIVYDAGDGLPGRPILPTGFLNATEKINQDGWFRTWLTQAATSEAGVATLWVIGSNAVEEKSGTSSVLYPSFMGARLVHTSQPAAVNPAVEGGTSFAFETGAGPAVVDFTTGDRALFMVAASCATPRSYDGLGVTGTGAPVYRYKDAAGTLSDAAMVMNSNPAARWNTILQSHPWFHIHDTTGSPPTSAGSARDLAGAILAAVVPGCSPGVPVGVPDDPVIEAPARTVLHPNVPNPFNPMTEIRFDLARSGRVKLRIYDVAGGLVRTLVDAEMGSGFGKRLLWNGLDAAGRRVPSGLYFARLEAADVVETRKMLLLQ